MARIKITDLPKDQKISKEELKRIRGGWKVEEGESITMTRPLSYFPKVEISSDIKW